MALNKNAKKWVRALRSGKYKKTIGQLAENGRFCCLGVACELAMQDGLISGYAGTDGGLEYDVKEWLGLNDELGAFDKDKNVDGKPCHSLADLNDSGWSFRKIADLIEKQPEGLFIK
jgi:hypothetical protein